MTKAARAVQIALALLLLPAVNHASGIPARLVVDSAGDPLWLAADQLIGVDGRVMAGLLPPWAEDQLRRTIADFSGKDCVTVSEVHDSLANVPARDSIKKLVRASDLIVAGTVTGQEYGFLLGIPGQMLSVAPLETIRGATTEGQYLVFYPVAQFTVADLRFCKTDMRLPAPPSVGDEVVVSTMSNALRHREFLELIDEFGVFVVRSDGSADLPRRLRLDADTLAARRSAESTPGLSRDALLSTLRSLAAEALR